MNTKLTLAISAIVAVGLSLPFYGQRWNLVMHIVGAVLLLGNIIVTALWANLARRSRHTEAVRLGVRGIIVADAVFTMPGAVLVLLNGGIIATPFFRARAMWLFVSIALFLLSGVLWSAVLVPTQRRLSRLMKATPGGASLPPDADGLFARWFRWGGVATLMTLVTLVLMVLKPNF